MTQERKNRGYRTASVNSDILDAIEEIVADKNFMYKTTSEFINSTLRDKVNELRRR